MDVKSGRLSLSTKAGDEAKKRKSPDKSERVGIYAHVNIKTVGKLKFALCKVAGKTYHVVKRSPHCPDHMAKVKIVRIYVRFSNVLITNVVKWVKSRSFSERLSRVV